MSMNATDSTGQFNVGAGKFNTGSGNSFNVVNIGGGGGDFIDLEGTGRITLEDGSGAILLE